jgi:UDP-3-O-[3-hydroxymyristoyl] N-acetylglucosamine deacetylase
MYERTLANPIHFEGVGLHTGQPVSMEVRPAPAGTGVVFRRVDLDDFEIPAEVSSVSRVAYATTLMRNGVWISTVEHLLSALYGVGVDNAYVDMDNLEVPILDGSAGPFTEAIASVGLTTQDRSREYLRIVREFSVHDEEGGKSVTIYPAEGFEVECAIDFDHPFIGSQKLSVEFSGDAYSASIAPARTFTFESVVATLRKDDLIRGGSLDNAIVLTDTGMLNKSPLRFKDEFVRHKILDILGDFALIRRPVLGRLVARRAGHALHTRFVAGLLESIDHWVLDQGAVRSTPVPG